MLQIIQNLKNGQTLLEEVPAPLICKGSLLIKTHCSLVSLGTEKMLIEFSKGNIFNKAKQQPERVVQVLQKIQTDGLLPTLESVFNKLDEPLPLGYCNAGEVIAVGEGVQDFKIGDRVASNGAHAEIVCIPQNLAVKIPDNVLYDEASFTVIGAIGLQGIRLANPSLGETVVVVGLGLIGLITAQMLQINGCNVIGFDFDENKISLAKEFGIKAFSSHSVDVVKIVEEMTNGIGCDAAIITASTKGNDVISEAAQMCRKKGRIVLVGVIGLDIKRADFYKKELTFQVSCSYGPGRYDDAYENKGIDYPIAYVRWTEKRNFEAILNAISKKQLNVSRLITHKSKLSDYLDIYNNINSGVIASILEYPVSSTHQESIVSVKNNSCKSSKGVVGIIGAGNFTKMTVMPALKKSDARLKYISSAGGLTSKALAKKYGFEFSTTDYKIILDDAEVDLVMITTRHNLHASMVVESLKAGKNVFVEKPLALNEEELLDIQTTYTNLSKPILLTVGFNRRFSPFLQKANQLFGNSPSPINMIATVNAGFIPPDVWIQDMKVGGGRIIGEACHFIDAMIYLSGSKVSEVCASGLGLNAGRNSDNAILTLKFENGSQGVINYFSNGNKKYSKERMEVYSQSRVLIIDNFRKMYGYGFKNFSSMSSRLDKGHKNQFELLIRRIKEGGLSLIPFDQLFNATKASFAAIESIQTKGWVKIS